MNKGVNVMLLFICSIVFLAAASFWFVWSERKAESLSYRNIEKSIFDLKKTDEYTGKHLAETRDVLDKLTKRIEWLEMKSTATSSKKVEPIKVEPITVNIVYRKRKKTINDVTSKESFKNYKQNNKGREI